MLDAGTFANDAVVVLGVLGGFAGLAKTKWFSGLLGFVKKDGVAIVQEVEHVAKEFVDTPAVKLQLEHAQNELDSVMSKYKESEVSKVTATVLNAFSENLSELSPTQKEAVVLQISNMFPKEWNITKAEIETALEAVQKGSDAVAEVSYIKTANEFKKETLIAQNQTVSA